MKPDPPYLYDHGFAEVYDQANGRGLAGLVLRAGHRAVEAPFPASARFERVIEVGAGTGAHLPFVRHAYGEYLMTDGSPAMLEAARTRHAGVPNLAYAVGDATRIDHPDGSFDRRTRSPGSVQYRPSQPTSASGSPSVQSSQSRTAATRAVAGSDRQLPRR